MTYDYVRLSLTAGYLAGQWDEALGAPHFATLARTYRWNLTWELLGEWKQDARKRGVPEELLELPADLAEAFRQPDVLARMREVQQASDARWSRETGRAPVGPVRPQ